MDNRLFAFKTSLLLQDSAKYAFIVSAFGDGECGISMSENDTITYITYIPSIDRWLRDRNSASADGNTIPPLKKHEYKVKTPTHRDYLNIQQFLRSIAADAKYTNQPLKVFDGISWLIKADDNWVEITTANESYNRQGYGEATDVLAKIAIACENHNPHELTSDYLNINH